MRMGGSPLPLVGTMGLQAYLVLAPNGEAP